MKFPRFIVLICFIFTFSSSAFMQNQQDVIYKVDPFWGVMEGNIFPGVSEPFGMVKLSPNIKTNSTPTSGYRPDEDLVGFSHTQTSGTGGAPRYGNILIIPQVDTLITNSSFRLKKMNETAFPGYYAVTLKNKNSVTRAELTASKKVGFHRYTFSKYKMTERPMSANILVDVSNCTSRFSNGKPRTYCKSGKVSIVSKTEIEGFAYCTGGWGGENPYTIYFVIKFDEPFSTSGVWQNDLIKKGKKKLIFNNEALTGRFGAFVSFSKGHNETVDCRVAISYLSIDKARANLKEKQSVDFDQARLNTSDFWRNELNKIEVSGKNVIAQKLFYSALRNVMLMPTDVTGEVKGWDSKTPHFWDFYCIWDIYRATMPLYTLIYPDKQRDMINCLLDIYLKRGWMPDAWVAGDFAQIQGGSNTDVVIADAVVKKLGGFNLELALSAVIKSAEVQSDNPKLRGRYVNDYKKYGYVLSENSAGSVSRTLEYAYNDFCIFQIADMAGEARVAGLYKIQSTNVFKLFNPEYKMFWGKDSLQLWKPGFSPVPTRGDTWNDPYFYEGGSLIYSTYMPHDMAGLIALHNGNEAFRLYLDKIFDSGTFSISNEPEFLIPYMYLYAGDYPSTAKRVHDILTMKFLPGTNGIPGQDDSGSMSAWYIFSSMGFFPVAGQNLYLIGTPLFEQSVIHLDGNKSFVVKVKNLSDKNMYVVKATLNGKPWNRSWFKHTDIYKGGELVLHMDAIPGNWGKADLPPSISSQL